MSFAAAILALAAVLHGFACVLFGLYIPAIAPEWRERSHAARTAVPILYVAAGAVMLVTALAIGLWPVHASAWALLACGASLLTLAGFMTFWDGRGAMFVSEGGLGAVITIAIATAAALLAH